jgi:hypothetical protein
VGAGVQFVETCIFLRGTVMIETSHEKHAKQQWKKKHKIQKKQKVQTYGQGLGRGLAGDMGLNFLFFFFVFPWFFAVWPKPRENQKNKKKQTHGQGLGYRLIDSVFLASVLFFTLCQLR